MERKINSLGYARVNPASARSIRLVSLIAFLFFFISNNAFSQCDDLTCNDHINVSLGENCDRIITIDDILEGEASECEELIVKIAYPLNISHHYLSQYPDMDVVDGTMNGYTLVASVKNPITGNSCWGRITVEDKYPPVIECADTMISCFQVFSFPIPIKGDNCKYPAMTQVVNETLTKIECEQDSNIIAVVTRTVRAYDIWDNMFECNQIMNIVKESLDSFEAPEDTLVDCSDRQLRIEYRGTFWEWVDGRKHPLPVIIKNTNQGIGAPPKIGDVYLWPNHGACKVYSAYKDHVIETCGHSYKIRREWKVVDWCGPRDTVIHQYIVIQDTTPPIITAFNGKTEYYADAHECKTKVELKPPNFTECWDNDNVEFHYSVGYNNEDHPAKSFNYFGKMESGDTKIVYIPAGQHKVTWTLVDACGNHTEGEQMFTIVDITPPTPVCDEHTQISLDPRSCWARVYAEDLDDGSTDNCCGKLHFAIAHMDSVSYYTEKWTNYYKDCLQHDYHNYKNEVEDLINYWIDCYVFQDYIDLTLEVGMSLTDSVIMRVYESCGLKPYDPHVFHGTQHEWFCYQKYDGYAIHYSYTLPDRLKYIVEKPDMICENHYGTHEIGIDYDYSDATTAIASLSSDYGFEKAVLTILYDSRWPFESFYSDCMVEILKDDKVPPTCSILESKTIFCDGLVSPVAGKYCNSGPINPRTAFSFCSYGEMPSHYCSNSSYSGGPPCCFGTPYETPYGYYGGPAKDKFGQEYGEFDPCGYKIYSESSSRNVSGYQNWRPIYCREWLELDEYDMEDYEKIDPFSYLDEPETDDNCGTPAVSHTDQSYFNSCGAGYVIRTFTVRDAWGNEAQCSQTIWVQARSDFEVLFPPDMELNCEEADALSDLSDDEITALTGAPEIHDAECEVIAISHEDTKFEIVDEACYKIVRKWTVIDWCTYDPDNNFVGPDVIVNDTFVASDRRNCVYRYLKDNGNGVMTYTQIIKVIDTQDPVIVLCSPDTTFCITDTECTMRMVDYKLGEASDNCTPAEDMAYRWIVYLNGELDNPNAVHGLSEYLNYTFPTGDHLVYFFAADKCGNEDTCITSFTIEDCKAPTPVCKTGLVSVVMDGSGEVEIWANDFNLKSTDNCTLPEDLLFSFSADTSDTKKLFNCDSLPNGGQRLFDVNIYVWDENGNYDYCSPTMLLQDNFNTICFGVRALAPIKGEIKTQDNEEVEFVKVALMTGNNFLSPFTTGVDGKYIFSSFPEAESYSVVPFRNDDHMNGLSTLDLVLIQKHILGIEKFSSPYRIIAADINNSKSVTAIDLVELRKLILGIYDKLPANSSWRFVNSSYIFDDVLKPWGFEEKIDIEVLDNLGSSDFIGVKVGDVNSTNIPHSLMKVETREELGNLQFTIPQLDLAKGSTLHVPIYADNFQNVDGYQFTFNMPGLSIQEILPGQLEINSSHFGFQHIDDGLVSTSWSSATPVTISSDKALFTIVLTSEVTGELTDHLGIGSQITAAESYINGQIWNVSLNPIIADNQHITLYQNNPNPFKNETNIGFILPRVMECELLIHDVSGKVLKEIKGTFQKGFNSIKIEKNDLASSGIVYYSLQTDEFFATKKMVLIDAGN